MTRRLLALFGLAALHLATPLPAGAAPMSVGETLRSAPSPDAPSRGTFTRAAGGGDEHRATDGSGFTPVAPFDGGDEPTLQASNVREDASSPPRSARRLLPPSRAPPA